MSYILVPFAAASIAFTTTRERHPLLGLWAGPIAGPLEGIAGGIR
jgi:hypothetical protein